MLKILFATLQSFNADLNDKRNAVKDIINKCNKMLRETTNAQTDEIKSRLEEIKSQVGMNLSPKHPIDWFVQNVTGVIDMKNGCAYPNLQFSIWHFHRVMAHFF